MIKILTDVQSGTFFIQFPYNPKIIEAVKTIDGRKYQPDLKLWTLPATPAQASMIDRTLSYYQYTGDEAFHGMLAQHNRGLDGMAAAPVYRETCTPCFKHQLVGLDLIINREAVLLYYGMGTGKTKTVIDAAGVLRVNRILILCPSKVVNVWPREFGKHGYTYGIQCIALRKKSIEYRTRIAIKALNMGRTALVINYEAAWHEPFNRFALAQQWDMVILDESHRCKTSKAKVTKFVHKLANRATRRVCLTGTPIPNNPIDLWAQCKFLDEGLFGPSLMAFKARYCVFGGYEDKQVVAFRNLDQMNQRFYEIAHRVTKEEALDLPSQMDETIEVELSPKATRIYNEMEGNFIAEVEDGTITLSNVLVEALRMHQCTGGAIKYDGQDDVTEVDTEKSDTLSDIASDLPATEPIVVFCRFRHDLDAVHRAAAAIGRQSCELSGRRDEWEDWQYHRTGGEVLAVQIQAGGLGVDLTRACYTFYYSLSESLGDYEQSRARLHRQGQTRPVTYYHLLALANGRQTIDHKIYRALAKKENIANAVLTTKTEN